MESSIFSCFVSHHRAVALLSLLLLLLPVAVAVAVVILLLLTCKLDLLHDSWFLAFVLASRSNEYDEIGIGVEAAIHTHTLQSPEIELLATCIAGQVATKSTPHRTHITCEEDVLRFINNLCKFSRCCKSHHGSVNAAAGTLHRSTHTHDTGTLFAIWNCNHFLGAVM